MRYEAGNSTTTSDTFTCENLKKIIYTSRFVRVILAQGPC